MGRLFSAFLRWSLRAQLAHFRNYLNGVLLQRDRPKTPTARADAEPLMQAQAASVQRKRFFVSERE